MRKEKLLCEIVGTGVLDGPSLQYTAFGQSAEKHLNYMSDFYEDLKVEKYVIMPNHIHLLIHLLDRGGGPSGRPVPTNSKISKFVGTFKRFCNQDYGRNIWQYRSHDHIIRGEEDYVKIWEYIDNNPARWADDCFFVK